MITPIEVVYAKETLDAGDSGFGLLLGVLGRRHGPRQLALRARARRSLPALIAFGTVAMAVGYLGMAVAPTLAVACVASAVGGLGNGVQWVAVVTALQEATEDDFQARVAGLFEAVATVAPGLGFLIGGLITAALSPRVRLRRVRAAACWCSCSSARSCSHGTALRAAPAAPPSRSPEPAAG